MQALKFYIFGNSGPSRISSVCQTFRLDGIPPYEKGDTILGTFFTVFWGLLVANPLPPTPFLVIFFFPYNPHSAPSRQTPPAVPWTREDLISVHFGSIWLRSGPFWLRLAPFRVCFGSVSGLFRGVVGGVGVGSGRGASVREKNITIFFETSEVVEGKLSSTRKPRSPTTSEGHNPPQGSPEKFASQKGS